MSASYQSLHAPLREFCANEPSSEKFEAMKSHSVALFVSKLNLPKKLPSKGGECDSIIVLSGTNGCGKKKLLCVALSSEFFLDQALLRINTEGRPQESDAMFIMTELGDLEEKVVGVFAGTTYSKLHLCLSKALASIRSIDRSEFEYCTEQALQGAALNCIKPLCSFLVRFVEEEMIDELVTEFVHFYCNIRPDPLLHKVFMDRGHHQELTTRIGLSLSVGALDLGGAVDLARITAADTARFWRDTPVHTDEVRQLSTARSPGLNSRDLERRQFGTLHL